MPSGVPMSTASTVRIRLPTIGFSRPPSAPGGGVISVKTASESPEKPCHSSSPRINTSQPRPNSVAATDRPIVIRLRRRLGGESRFEATAVMALPDPPLDPHQHVAGGGQHD